MADLKSYESQVKRFEELESGQMYRISQDKGDDLYFGIHEDYSGNFYWVDKQDGSLGITNTPRLSETDIPQEDVDDKKSFVTLHFFNGIGSPYTDRPVANVKRDIQDGQYIHVGPIDEKRHLVPDK